MTHALRILAAITFAAALSFGQKAPQPKSQKEVEALMAIQNAQTPDARIKAVEDLLTKFADTEFKPMALQLAMQSAQQKSDHALTVAYAERVLEADPKSYFATITLAGDTVQTTREFDLDKEEKLAKAEKYAHQTLDLIATAQKPRPDLSDEQWEGAKKDVIRQSHDVLGLVAMQRKKFDVAITEFKTAVDTTPEPTSIIRLGEAYLSAGKPDEAIAQFTRAESMSDLPQQFKARIQAKKAEAEKMKSGAGAKPAGSQAPQQIEIKKP